MEARCRAQAEAGWTLALRKGEGVIVRRQIFHRPFSQGGGVRQIKRKGIRGRTRHARQKPTTDIKALYQETSMAQAGRPKAF